MRYYILLISFILLTSCSDTETCTLKFTHYLHSEFLKMWNDRTIIKLHKMGTKKAALGLDLEKRYNGALFDRKNFIKVLEGTKKYNGLEFNEIVIFEIKYTGEKNQSVKYLVGSCGRESIVIKFGLGVKGWIISNEYKISTEKIAHFYKVLDKKEKEIYWGSAITEIACLTRIKGYSQINIQIIESLSELQIDTLMGLQTAD